MVLQRHRINARSIERGDHRLQAHVAELGDLGALALGQRHFAATQQQVRLDAKRGQFAHRVLRRLGLQLARRLDIGHQRDVHRAGHVAAHFVAQLANGLDERQAFDIAYGAADLAQHEIDIVGGGAGEFLDRVGHVRDHLHCCAKVITASFLGDNVAVNPARCDVIGLACRNAGEAFVVAKIEIGFSAVVGYVDFAMLIGAHRARIDIEIGIELADTHAEAARLQQRGEACRHQTFAKRGDHAAGNENEPRHGSRALIPQQGNGQAAQAAIHSRAFNVRRL